MLFLFLLPVLRISIHAPREGGDVRVIVLPVIVTVISIHAPREGGDLSAFLKTVDKYRFQSTPPARGATERLHFSISISQFQSTPPARGATCNCKGYSPISDLISIHAPREGGDWNGRLESNQHIRISIHAPREGGDTGS